MSDQYYYLLDGKEHGPFSRTAVKTLLHSGKLNDALLKSGPEQSWKTIDEFELAAEPPATQQPISDDPAAVVFRSGREIKRSSSASPILIGLIVLGIAGAGLWVAYPKHGRQSLTSVTQNNTSTEPPSTNLSETKVSVSQSAAILDGHEKEAAERGAIAIQLEDLTQGVWRFWNTNEDFISNKKLFVESPTASGAQEVQARGVTRLLLPKGSRYTRDGGYAPLRRGSWRGDQCLTTSFRTLTVVSLTDMGLGVQAMPVDFNAGVCEAREDIAELNGKDGLDWIHHVSAGQLYRFRATQSVTSIIPLPNIVKVNSTVEMHGTMEYTPNPIARVCFTSDDAFNVSLSSPVPQADSHFCFSNMDNAIAGIGKPDLVGGAGCTYKAESTIWLSRGSGKEPIEDGAAELIEVQELSPFRLAEATCEAAFSGASISKPAPGRYPPSAEREGIEGSVTMLLSISYDGSVSNVAITQSSRNRELDSAAIRTAKTWRYEPSKAGGQVQEVLKFSLSQGETSSG